MRIQIAVEFPDQLRDEVETFVREFLWIVPTWCHELDIEWDPDASNGAARSVIKPRYRQAHLLIHPAYLECDIDFRRGIIAHEMIHIALGPIVTFGARLIEDFTPEDGIRKFVQEEWASRFESVVEDLALAISRPRP